MNLVWTQERWLPVALLLGLLATVGVAWIYFRATALPPWARFGCGALKLLAFALLILMLLGPEVVTSRAVPGENIVAMLADTSASMQIRDQEEGATRGERLQEILTPGVSNWLTRLENDFVVERFTFDARLRPNDLTKLDFKGGRTDMNDALGQIATRYRNRPLSAVLVLTDGSVTGLRETSPEMPPVFFAPLSPVKPPRDLAIESIRSTASAFEEAPVMVDASLRALGVAHREVEVALRDREGRVLDSQRVRPDSDDEVLALRFKAPTFAGETAFFEVKAGLVKAGDQEVTLENNTRLVAANRVAGPYRILYVGGRPNWDHKFLQRALDQDRELELVSLIRIAGKEPSTDLGPAVSRTNPLYRGSGVRPEEAERYDEPVLLRLRTRDAEELRGGFPETSEGLFPFDAVVLDEIEAGFFSYDQQTLLQRYVSERGGSLLMLGGRDALTDGAWAGTPVGEILPLYFPTLASTAAVSGPVRIGLTRDGMLQPWMRLRSMEEQEQERLKTLPSFLVHQEMGRPKPGASVLAEYSGSGANKAPAIATQRFGDGRTSVIAIGDLWRWGFSDAKAFGEFARQWRQMLRGLLADVPRRVSIAGETDPDGLGERIAVRVRGPDFQPQSNARVLLRAQGPDGKWRDLPVRPDPAEPGVYFAEVSEHQPGMWLAEATVADPSDDFSGRTTTGWVAQPGGEFQTIVPNLEAMQTVAIATGGRVLAPADLDTLAESIPPRTLAVTETKSQPLWHHAVWLVAAIVCLAGEWSLRRSFGLP